MPDNDVMLEAVFADIDDDDDLYKLTLSASDGVIATDDDRYSYAAGEEVTLLLNPLTGYEIGSVSVNGSYIAGDTFIMPSEDTVVVAEFVKRGYYVAFSGDMNFQGTLSANNAYEGDLIAFDITPDAGYIISSVQLKILGEDENPVSVLELDDYSFVMPKANVFICVSTRAVSNVSFALKAEEFEGGTVSFHNATARYGETVYATVTPDEGYRLKSGSLKISYISAGVPVTVAVGEEFVMPDSDVTVIAEFERVYKVGCIDEYNISVYPSVTEIAVGEAVQFIATTRGDYNYGSIELTVTTGGGYSGALDESGVFILTAEYAGDVSISYDAGKYDKVSNSTYYSSISIANVKGGYITVPRYNAVYAGTVVPITAVASEGYELKSITLSTPDSSGFTSNLTKRPAAELSVSRISSPLPRLSQSTEYSVS